MQKTRRFNTLTDFMRYLFGGLLTRIGERLYQWGVHPDAVTLLGLVIVAGAAAVAAHGEFVWAGVIILLGAPLDAIDGAVARAMQRQGKFGALFDSVMDRYADGFIFSGLAYYYSTQGDHVLVLAALLALLGSLLVSYVRARAEGLQVDCKVGLFTRMERMVIILVMLFTGLVPLGLGVLVIGTHLTVGQRVWHVYQQLARR